MDVADWLRALDLGQYESAFHENSITAELLPSLTSEDLKDLGISRVGHRRRLLDAIATLRTGTIPDTLVIDEATRRQVGGLFELADLGPQALAGFAAPQPAWCVLGESEILSRFEALRSEVTPLIGRDEELNLLQRRWQQAKAGEGRLVLLSGDPGIGKSRLIAALVQYIAGESHTRLRYFCSPHNQDSALLPVRGAARACCRTRPRRNARAKAQASSKSLLAPGARGPEEIAVIAELLSLPNITEQFNLTPQRKRERCHLMVANSSPPDPLRSRIAREGLNPNMDAPPIPVDQPTPWIGRALPRVEDAALLTGRGRYFDDTATPRDPARRHPSLPPRPRHHRRDRHRQGCRSARCHGDPDRHRYQSPYQQPRRGRQSSRRVPAIAHDRVR